MRSKTIAQVLSILSPSIVLRALAMDIFIPCLPMVAKEFNASFGAAQWVLSIYFIGAGLGQLVMGPLADHFGRRKVILSSIVLFAVSSILCAGANSIYELIFFRLLQGIGACGTTVVTLAIVRDLFEDHATPKVYSYVNSIIALAPILAPLLGGSLLVWTGTWRSCFYFVTVFSLLAFAVNYFYLKETNPRFAVDVQLEKIKLLSNYREIFTNKLFLIFTCCSIAGLSGLFLFFSMSAILLIDILAVAPDNYGYYFGFNSIIYLCGNMLSPKLQQKLGSDRVIKIGSGLALLGAVVMLLWHWQLGLSKTGLLAPNLLITFGIGLIFGPCMAGAMRNFKHIAGMASASYGALLYCISALIVAWVMQYQISNTLPLAIMILIMSVFSLLILRKV